MTIRWAEKNLHSSSLGDSQIKTNPFDGKEVDEMKKLLQLCLTLMMLLAMSANSQAAYIIDGDLSDWGVTPFTDWVPDSATANYITQDDTANRPDIVNFGEEWDFEALYFDDDLDRLYFAFVTSCAWNDPGYGQAIGDLGLDLNGDHSIGSGGIVTGLEYGVRLVDMTHAVVSDPTWSVAYEWYSSTEQNSPWRVQDSSGTVVGYAAVAYNETSVTEPAPRYWDSDYDRVTVVEIAVSRTVFSYLQPADAVFTHITCHCGNDAINLTGIVDVPEPATFVLLGLGLASILRTRKE